MIAGGDPYRAVATRFDAALLGQTTHLVWSEQAANGSDYDFASGGRYAVLASVSLNYSLSDVTSYLTNHGWAVTYAWEQGTPSRGIYPVDAWLDGLAPDTTSNHRWLYAEANRTGGDTSYGVNAPWPLTIYSISHVLHAEPAPAGQEAPVLPPTTSAPASSGPGVGAIIALGVLSGALGAVGYLLVRRVWVPPLAHAAYY